VRKKRRLELTRSGELLLVKVKVKAKALLSEATLYASFAQEFHGRNDPIISAFPAAAAQVWPDIAAMPNMYAYSKEFFARYYRPENVTLLVTGDVKPETVFQLAEKSYGGWQRGYQTPTVPEEPPQTEERRIEVSYQGRSLPIVWAAYKLPRIPASRLRAGSISPSSSARLNGVPWK